MWSWRRAGVSVDGQLGAAAAGGHLLLAPQAVNEAMAPSRIMPTEERLTLQSWACFMIAVAGIAHAAISFPAAAQRAIAKALFVCFTLESILYAKALAVDLASHPLDYKVGFGSTGHRTEAAKPAALVWFSRVKGFSNLFSPQDACTYSGPSVYDAPSTVALIFLPVCSVACR